MLLTAIALKRFSILSPDLADTSQYPALHSFASSSPSSSVTYLLSSRSFLLPTKNNKISSPFYSSTIFFFRDQHQRMQCFQSHHKLLLLSYKYQLNNNNYQYCSPLHKKELVI
eukprot:TRINITY_DN4746_c0_g1_i1.p2 TRINITY_DN4746_c0_g1~~TRINITY_DN4746_c0_g1_i1.p2  ORF type:complete len:113 (+),score=2.26 TRINITY_DN4746_c0_g1_i1:212-550(+)